jgi:hypothetical protein
METATGPRPSLFFMGDATVIFRREYGTWGGVAYHQDYLMRQIKQLGVFLARLMQMKRGDGPEATVEAIHAAGKSLLGVDLEMLSTLSEGSVLALFHTGPALDAGKCLIAGVLLHERGDLLAAENPEAAERDRLKALSLLLTALLMEKGLRTGEYPVRAEALAVQLGPSNLPAPLLLKLYRDHETMGRYALAEDALHFMREDGSPAWAEEAAGFYGRMTALSDGKLNAGGLPREEVEETLAALKASFASSRTE